MANKKELVEQTRLAFDFLQKLYLESSYLVKEIEGILHEEEEKFIIARPAGYSICAAKSSGLESTNVNLWLLRKFSVYFIPEDKSELRAGQTFTKIENDLKVIFLHIILDDKEIPQPVIHSGVFFNIQKNPNSKGIKKFENILGHIEYRTTKILKAAPQIDYEDVHIKLKGEIFTKPLYELSDSESIIKNIITPMLELYRKY